MIKDNLGVPQEPSELPNIHIGYDWLGQDIYSDDGDDYIELDDYLVLDDYPNLRCHMLDEMGGYILNTMEIYEGVENG